MSSLHDIWTVSRPPPQLASLTFFEKTTDGSPRAFWLKGPIDPSIDGPRTNISYRVTNNIPIYDLRDHMEQLSIDKHGFEMVRHHSALIKNQYDPKITEIYMKEIQTLIQTTLGAHRVFCYDLRFRENLSAEARQELATKDAGSSRVPDSPGWQVHVDQTREGGYEHVRRILSPDDAQTYLMDNENWRIRIINAWRPVSGTIGDAPLAFCDFATISNEDLTPTDRPWNGIAREIYNLKWNSRQRWYWIRDQTTEEVILFSNWNSAPDDGPPFCAHASFLNSAANPALPRRRSIEVRALVISKKNNQEVIPS